MATVSRQEFLDFFSSIPKLPEGTKVTFESKLEDYDLDSIDLADMSFDLEDKYDLSLPFLDEPLETVEDIYQLVVNAKSDEFV